ncbi:SnoaL-like domain-containing protein [Formosa sp. Hel1_31_208]|uniref:nuclear transport factor 2 family protein n=1 Tax=Formosa sp. Hel1_31_208 TaxID=1798225 RepID=UPI00087ABBA5|nr:nuclear transport factor 2 family protein [Formosa sp. Hel1_31_208]SDS27745.1 SnoaL-like domain-containing protein [Formosa sp. Hel1_31_208]
MKNYLILTMMMFTIIMFPQKKKNGTIYVDHPSIKMVEEMQQAYVKGDTIKVASYLAEDFKAFDGMDTDPDDEGMNKSQFVRSSMGWQNNVDYLSISRSGGYPDALEYKDSGLWIQTWDMLKGVHKGTGVKLSMPIHRMFRINKENKIDMVITYDDRGVWAKMRDAFSTRKNGTLYNEHENINTVRKMVRAMEHGDLEKSFSFFTEKARFRNLDMKEDEFNTVAQEKENFQKMSEVWDIESIDVVGYPDYLEYEVNDTRVVQSWWNLRLKRKSDDKRVKIPVLLMHRFDEDGKIFNEMGYYTASTLMED